VHPYFTNEAARQASLDRGILVEAWSPIAQGDVLDDPAVVAIAERLRRTPAQVVLRWHVQRGDIIFPKSMSPARMKENFAIFDFELDQSDIEALSALDRGEEGRRGPNPDVFDYIPG
jgi:2,5-diketo-D-gluconate reductase A